MRIVAIILLISLVALAAGGLWLHAPDKSRAVLEPIYAPAPSGFVLVGGIRFHVRDTGPRDAPVVILLHGFGASLHTWEAWARTLSADRRVIRLDLPGFGLTGADPTGDYSDARAVTLLAGLMDRLAVPRASLVGNSMGGRIAWKFALALPERVDRLVLISPDGFASPGMAYGQKASVPVVARLLPYFLPTAMLRANLAPSYADPARLTDGTVVRYRDMLLAPGVRHAILARTGQVVLEDPVPLLGHLKAPTLVLWGEKDGMIPFSNAADYLAAIPNATLVSLPDLGHVPHEEAPAVSLSPVRAFLAD